MSKFTRIDRHATAPRARDSRVYGQKIALGEPVQLSGGEDLRGQIEDSLEQIAKERLLQAERDARQLARSIIEEAETKARATAQEILEQANAQAKALIQNAQEQEQEIRDTAQETGFKTGFQEGYADATAQVEQETLQLLENARLVLEAAYQAEKRVLQDFESQALALIRHLARKILHRELSESPENLLQMLAHATEALYLSGKVRVVLNPQVLHEIRQFSEKTAGGLDALQRFEFVADPMIEPRQIYIIGQESSFDLSLDTQVDLLTRSLQEHLKLPRPEPAEVVKPEASESAMEAEVQEVVGNLEGLEVNADSEEAFNPELMDTDALETLDDAENRHDDG
jgi:flagellar assembly protein FliH